MPIIGYIHICQIGEWKRSFDMLMKEILVSGLYDAATEIRCGILLDSNKNTYDLREIQYVLQSPMNYLPRTHRKILGDYVTTDKPTKLQIVYIGNPEEYERPTLLHMKKSAESDPPNTKYFYLHTKGLRWYGTPREECVVDWIKLLLYWNIENWCDAVDVLNKYDTYGCNYYNKSEYPPHYSGNFFWTTSYHLMTLPDTIGPHYNDPEFWISSIGRIGGKPNIYNAFCSSYEGLGHYEAHCPEYLYRK